MPGLQRGDQHADQGADHRQAEHEHDPHAYAPPCLWRNARTTYRAGLTKAQVFQAAVRVADEGGIAALTMRKLAQELGVEAMSHYHHVADKDEVLAGMADVVVSEI
ncbi:MAG TPA: TetR family transcriptional regulator, partial [Micromonosporaceae bacterium]|nr:TetR family transcriptional regulator [Micromonosporaceae bacterium]